MENNEVLSLEEVSKLVRLCKITVYKYIKQGRIPGTKAGNKWRFTRSQVLRALEAGFPVKGGVGNDIPGSRAVK